MVASDKRLRKARVDQLVVERGLAENRTQAQALIMAGRVFSGDRRLDKPGLRVGGDLPLEVRGRAHPWVSRGGVKLAHGLEVFSILPTGLVCLDIGASTGGFTDVLVADPKLHSDVKVVFMVFPGRGDPRRP